MAVKVTTPAQMAMFYAYMDKPEWAHWQPHECPPEKAVRVIEEQKAEIARLRAKVAELREEVKGWAEATASARGEGYGRE